MKKILIALAAALVLCVPAFAYESNSFVSQLEIGDNGVAAMTFSSRFSSEPVYFALVRNSSGGEYLTQYAFSLFNTSYLRNSNYESCSTTILVGTDTVYYGSYLSSLADYRVITDISIYPAGTEVTTIARDFLAWLDNPNPAPAGSPVTVHVPYGNVLYIKVDQRQENIQLVAHMPKLSFLIPDRNYGYWGETGICWGDYNTLPYSGLTFPLSGMSGIDWQRDSSRNILGQTKTGVATKIMNTGVWYALFCPSLFGHFDLDSSSALPGASVDVTGVFSDIRLYPLSDSYSFVDNEVINGSDSEYQNYFDGESTESGTVTWTDQDGNVSAPRAGGSSYVPEAETAESLVSQIKNILGNIVKELQTLFTFGYDAIQTLVNLMSDFVSGFSQLYTWLPAPVYSALIAAITVAIVIGVFKVFL